MMSQVIDRLILPPPSTTLDSFLVYNVDDEEDITMSEGQRARALTCLFEV